VSPITAYLNFTAATSMALVSSSVVGAVVSRISVQMINYLKPSKAEEENSL
jgi:hypothetical protein